MTGQLLTHTERMSADFPWKRWIKVLPLSCAATLGLMVTMERLIATAPVELAPLVKHVIPDIILPEKVVETIIDNKPIKPVKVEPEPTLPPPSMTLTHDGQQTLPAPTVSNKIEPPTLGVYSSDSPIPTVMVQANYPQRALSRGIEGYVEVAFDVTETGATTNVRVISANPENMFDRAAVRAVQSWKFSPVIVDGAPQFYSGMQRRVVFELEKS